MKNLLKQILFFTTPIFLLILLLFFFNIIIFDFKYAHQSSMVYNRPVDLHKYFVFSKIKDFTNSFSKEYNFKFKKIDQCRRTKADTTNKKHHYLQKMGECQIKLKQR